MARDTTFDDPKRYNSGGIRLHYKKHAGEIRGLKEGILLEAGYDTITPNMPRTISFWAYEKARNTPGIDIKDNRAYDIPCYDPRYTFVEKLQTICTKFRREQLTGESSVNYMRQYYDVYCLLSDSRVQEFVNTEEYLLHKKRRFPNEDLQMPVSENEALLLTNRSIRTDMQRRYELTRDLYYKGQPSFEEILFRIHQFIEYL